MCPGVFSVPQTDPASVPAVSRGRLERDRVGPRARLVPGLGVAPKVIGRRCGGSVHCDYVGGPESAPDELHGPAHPRVTILVPLELSHELPTPGSWVVHRTAPFFQVRRRTDLKSRAPYLTSRTPGGCRSWSHRQCLEPG